MLTIDPGLAPFIALGVLVVIFAGFVTERWPSDVIAIAGVAALLVLGILDTKAVLTVFGNPAPITIAAMYIIGAALIRTGALDAFTEVINRLSDKGPRRTVAMIIIGTIIMSAFMNNTPVVMVMIPVVLGLSQRIGWAPSRLMIPLSYAAILGGTFTLIGTSTNLLVDGVVRDMGMEPFRIFEITPLGLIVALAGGLLMGLFARRLLPERTTVASLLGRREPHSFLVEVLITHDSKLIGEDPRTVPLFNSSGRRLVDVVRKDETLRRDWDKVKLEAGDRVILKTPMGELMAMRQDDDVAVHGTDDLEPMSSRATLVVEALIGPSAKLIGRPLVELRLRRKYGVYPLALHREGANLEARRDYVPLKVGDTLLLEGAPEDLKRMSEDLNLMTLNEPDVQAYRRDKAPIALGALAGVVLLAFAGVLPIAGLAMIGVAVVLVSRCVDPEEAFAAVDWRILTLIFSMLAIGKSLETTGAVQMIVDAVVPLLHGLPPLAVLAVLYALSALLTELVTNNAVAIVMVPIVVGVAAQLGVDPRPFVVAVMFAASASFATPIGYQTNTLVYGPGGYRFADFLKIGIPMNLFIGTVTVLAIPYFWAF